METLCIETLCQLWMKTVTQAGASHHFCIFVFSRRNVFILLAFLFQANPPCLLSTIQYICNFYASQLSGEECYWWMQFTAAVEFIKTIDERKWGTTAICMGNCWWRNIHCNQLHCLLLNTQNKMLHID